MVSILPDYIYSNNIVKQRLYLCNGIYEDPSGNWHEIRQGYDPSDWDSCI